MKKLIISLAAVLLGIFTISSNASATATDDGDDGNCYAQVQTYAYKRDIPAEEEVSHLEYRYYKNIPDHAEVSHKAYKYKQDHPAVLEYEYKKPKLVDQHRYEKSTQTRTRTPVAVGLKTRYQYSEWVYHGHGQSQGWEDKGTEWGNYGEAIRPGGEAPPTGTAAHKAVYWQLINQETKADDWVWGPWGPYGPLTDWPGVGPLNWGEIPSPMSGDHDGGEPAEGSGEGISSSGSITNGEYDDDRRYQYVIVDTRQIQDGWIYEWFTSNPGAPWTARGSSREKTAPWTEFYNGGEWTVDVLDPPWVRSEEKAVIDSPYVAGYSLYYVDGADPSLNSADASWMLGPPAGDWVQYGAPKKVVDVPAASGYTEYYVEGGAPSLNEDVASFVDAATLEGWSQFKSSSRQGNRIPCKTPFSVEPLQTDPCGPNNAAWVVPSDTEEVTWQLVNGELIATTTQWYQFPDGSTTKNFGQPVDSDAPCPTTTTTQPPTTTTTVVEPTTTVTTQPTAVAQAVSPTPQPPTAPPPAAQVVPGPEDLAVSGSNSWIVLLVGSIAVLAGVTFLLFSRRRI
jgi:hypothetical protein